MAQAPETGEVAVVGLGRMGAAMARRLRAEGLEVAVHNRTLSRAEELAEEIGASIAPTAADAAGRHVVVTSLADDAALEEVYHGPEGIIAGLAEGTRVVETSTVDPETILGLAPEVDARSAVLLDAPVSGSVPAVESGTLTFMVGGPGDALEDVHAVLDVLGARTFHMGDTGTGASMKLAVNGVVHALNVALSEALVLAEQSGIARETAWDVFGSGAAGAPFVQYKRAAFLAPDQTPTAFSLELVAKDLELIRTLADRHGVTAEQVRTNLAMADRATRDGHGDRDMSWLAQLLRDRVRD